MSSINNKINNVSLIYSSVKEQTGISLLEVLIAIVIVSLGLLGVIKLQITNIKYVNDTKLRSQALMLTEDMMNRMRANQAQALLGAYDVPYEGALGAVTQCTDKDAVCSPADMATYDLTAWLCNIGHYNNSSICGGLGVEGSLPGGSGSISRDDNTITVSVRWIDQTDKSIYESMSVSARL